MAALTTINAIDDITIEMAVLTVNDKTAPFLNNLSAEIRNTIYGYVVASPDHDLVPIHSTNTDSHKTEYALVKRNGRAPNFSNTTQAAITMVNKQMRRETLAMFNASNTFRLDCTDPVGSNMLYKWLAGLGTKANWLRKVMIAFETRTFPIHEPNIVDFQCSRAEVEIEVVDGVGTKALVTRTGCEKHVWACQCAEQSMESEVAAFFTSLAVVPSEAGLNYSNLVVSLHRFCFDGQYNHQVLLEYECGKKDDEVRKETGCPKCGYGREMWFCADEW